MPEFPMHGDGQQHEVVSLGKQVLESFYCLTVWKWNCPPLPAGDKKDEIEMRRGRRWNYPDPENHTFLSQRQHTQAYVLGQAIQSASISSYNLPDRSEEPGFSQLLTL